jgi:alpha-1,2-mannosyltransferase
MFRVVSITMNGRIGLFFLLATVFSPGNFHASTALLPSSFAMYMSLLGGAAFMNWTGGLKTSWGIWWFALGGILGWPFASALCVPFVLEEGIYALMSDQTALFESFMRIARGIVAAGLFIVSWALYLGLIID